MLKEPMDVLRKFPVRKTGKQKQAFREAVQAYAESLGYTVTAEKGSFGCRNLVIGDPEKANYLVTAHYDTCARLPVPNWITPCNPLPFLGYQLVLTLGIAGVPMLAGLMLALIFRQENLIGITTYLGVWVMLGLMFFGPANSSNANDNTSGVVTVLEIVRTLPENLRGRTCFVLFDLEEAGLIGSASYRKAHRKATDTQLVLNLDCVGDGDHLMMFPTKKLKKDRKKLTGLYVSCGYFGKKSLTVREKGFATYPSDQKNFPYGVGICALNQGKFGLEMGRIHTPKDTVLDVTNVNLLRASLTALLTGKEIL